MPTPVVSHVYAYTRKEEEGDKHCAVIHVVSDLGKLDTIVDKLIQKCSEEVSLSYSREHQEGLEILRWVHAKDTKKVPKKAQALYIRPKVEGEE